MSFRFPSCNTDCVFCFRSQDFVYLTVGFKSLSYELQEEKLVYDMPCLVSCNTEMEI